MGEQMRPQRPDIDAKIWQSIIDAWTQLDDDDDIVVMTDIVPIEFATPAGGAGHHQRTMCWVWHKV